MLTNPLFLIPSLTGVAFIVLGIIQYRFPPKSINGFYGYRTSTSMKSQERWSFAQLYSAKEMIRLGFVLLLTSFMGYFYKPTAGIGTAIGLGLLIVLVVLLFIRTENAIKTRFGY